MQTLLGSSAMGHLVHGKPTSMSVETSECVARRSAQSLVYVDCIFGYDVAHVSLRRVRSTFGNSLRFLDRPALPAPAEEAWAQPFENIKPHNILHSYVLSCRKSTGLNSRSR